VGVGPLADRSDLTDNEYHDLADESMDTLHEGLEALVEDFGPPEWEVEYSVSVVT
jgi:frataxin-like iron-binding protein CyaY